MNEIFNEDLSREELVGIIRKNILLSGGMTTAIYDAIMNHPEGTVKLDSDTTSNIRNFAETAKVLMEFLK